MCKWILGQELRWTGRRRLQHKRRWYSSNCRFQDQRRKRWCKLNTIFRAVKLFKETHPFFRNTVTVSATSASMAKCNGLTTIMGEFFPSWFWITCFFQNIITHLSLLSGEGTFFRTHTASKNSCCGIAAWRIVLVNKKKGINEENAPGSAGDFSSSTMMNARYSKNSSAKCQVAHQFAASDSFCNSSSLLYCENFCRRNDAAKRRFWIWERI